MLALIDRHAELLDVSMKIARGACRAMRRQWRRERELKRAARLFSKGGAVVDEVRGIIINESRLPINASATLVLIDGVYPPCLTRSFSWVDDLQTPQYTITVCAHWFLVHFDRITRRNKRVEQLRKALKYKGPA